MSNEDNEKSKYYLYIDECGDQNLENYNPQFPVFTLCGVLISRDNKKKLEAVFNALKREFWGDESIIKLDRPANSRPYSISYSAQSS